MYDKKSFILYFDAYPLVALLPVEQSGMLFRAVYLYAMGIVQEPPVTQEEILAQFPEMAADHQNVLPGHLQCHHPGYPGLAAAAGSPHETVRQSAGGGEKDRQHRPDAVMHPAKPAGGGRRRLELYLGRKPCLFHPVIFCNRFEMAAGPLFRYSKHTTINRTEKGSCL